MTARTNEKPNAIQNRVSMWFAKGNSGTISEIAEAIGANRDSLRHTLQSMERAGRAQRVGQVEVHIPLQPHQPKAECLAYVWAGDAPSASPAPMAPVRRNKAIVEHALRAVEHLPRWLGGQAV